MIYYGITAIQVAMTRRHVRRDPTYELFKDVPAALPEECVSLKEALQAHTIHPAYQAHLENIKRLHRGWEIGGAGSFGQ